MPNSPRPVPAPRRTALGGLAAVVGTGAAALLFVGIPADESGRKVEAIVQPNGSVEIRHVSGPQYLRAYRDIAGIATACDGITPGIRMGQTFTEAQCAQLLERELIVHASGVMRCVPGLRSQPPGRIYAAVSLAYNIGVGAFCGSTAARRFNAGQWRAGCDAMLAWNKARVNGRLVVVRGLQLRREREHRECVK